LPAFGPAFLLRGQSPFRKKGSDPDHAGDFRVISSPVTKLSSRHCKPCEGGAQPLQAKEAEKLLASLHADWRISDDGLEISRAVTFPAYSRSLGFANAVAWIAISEGHHPDLLLSYSKCIVSYTTHAIGGLSDNDFICAAKVDQLIDTGE